MQLIATIPTRHQLKVNQGLDPIIGQNFIQTIYKSRKWLLRIWYRRTLEVAPGRGRANVNAYRGVLAIALHLY